MAYADTHLTFMLSTVHIAIYNKINTSAFIRFQNPDRMFIIIFPYVHVISASETEHLCHFIFRLIVAPQLSLLHKTDNISGFVRLVIHHIGSDSKINGIFGYVSAVSPENFFHGPFKI